MVADYVAIAGHVNGFGGVTANNLATDTNYGPAGRNGVMSYNSRIGIQGVSDGAVVTLTDSIDLAVLARLANRANGQTVTLP